MVASLRRLLILAVVSGGALSAAPAFGQTFSFTAPGPAGTCNLAGITLPTIDLAFAWSGFASPPNNLIVDVFVNGTLDPVLNGPIDVPAPSGNDAFVGVAPLGSPPASMPYTVQIAAFPAADGVAIGVGAVASIECIAGVATVTSLRNGIPAVAAAVPLSGALPWLLGTAVLVTAAAARRRRTQAR